MKKHCNLLKFSPIAVSVLLTLPAITYASVTMQNGTAGKTNGVTVVDINKPNSNGISHNIYDQLNVGKEGLIFNNSQNGASTVLAGQVAGNSNLSSGSAKVILNEVTSRNKSTLNGYMEVAGDKANLIIANPNGITCSNCGFINTDKATLTTGKPDMQNGDLKGFSVNGGQIEINGLKSESPTAVLSRFVVVNGNINTEELAVVAGNNYVNTNNQVTGTVTASGTRNTYSIDVAKVGGMYANKISLVSTENGVGVRNVGIIAAGNGGLQLDAKGRLINSNAQIKSSGDIGIKLAGNIDNVTGKIVSEKSVYIDTNKNEINNSRAGNILAGADIAVSSGAFNNTNGKVSAAGTLGINTNNATLTNTGKGNSVGMEAAIMVLETGRLNNNGGQINSYYLGTQSTSVTNVGGTIDVYSNIDMVSTGSIDNSRGLIRSAAGRVKIDASSNTVINSQTKSADTVSSDSLGIIAGDGGVEILSATLNNSNGQIASSNYVNLKNTDSINNSNGKVLATKTVTIQSASLNNSQAGISAKGDVNIELTGTFENRIGVVSSEEGTLNLNAQRVNNTAGLLMGQDININSDNDVNNDTAFIIAQNNLKITAQGNVYNQNGQRFGSTYGTYFGMPNQEGGMVAKGSVDISARTINNARSRIIAEKGPLDLAVTDSLSNERGMLVSGMAAKIKADSINNNYATIYAAGDLNINTRTLNMYSNGNILDNNATGVIASDNDLTLNVGSSFTNYGWISGKNKVALAVNGILYNRNIINANNEASISGKSAIYNYNDMVGGNLLTVTSDGTIYNRGNMVSDGMAFALAGQSFYNYQDMIAGYYLMATAGNILYNSGNIFTEGAASITARTITNTRTGILGGRSGLELKADRVTDSGIIVGL